MRRGKTPPLVPEKAAEPEPLTDEQLNAEYMKRFRARFQRVYAVMKQERIDFGAQHFIADDGRPAARVIPIEMKQ